MAAASNLTQRLLHALRERGATEVFGIPGDFALPLFGEIERAQVLPLYTMSHEPGVGFAADAAARMRGGLGVAAVTYGAGALNLVNSVAGAYAERVPVVVVSGAPAAHEAASGLLLHHQVKALDSQWRVYAEITAAQARLDDMEQAPRRIAEVLDTALRLSRPVYLEIPRDQPALRCGPVPRLSRPQPDAEALDACADELLQQLRAAQRPVLMAGVEVRRYGLEAQVAELARRLRVPVVTSFMGRGLLSAAKPPPLRSTAASRSRTTTIRTSRWPRWSSGCSRGCPARRARRAPVPQRRRRASRRRRSRRRARRCSPRTSPPRSAS